jgi:uncharacterized alkaline shock family protein YloU
MAEKMDIEEVKTQEIGQIQIADEVIAIIAGIAATEVDGIAGMSGNITGDIAELLGRKNLSKGVKISVGQKEVSIELNIIIEFGVKIPKVAVEVQKRVQSAVETMTGLVVTEINLNIMGIHFGKEKQNDIDKE